MGWQIVPSIVRPSRLFIIIKRNRLTNCRSCFSARMSVTYDYSRFVPSVHAGRVLPQRRETEEWGKLCMSIHASTIIIIPSSGAYGLLPPNIKRPGAIPRTYCSNAMESVHRLVRSHSIGMLSAVQLTLPLVTGCLSINILGKSLIHIFARTQCCLLLLTH